jgi:hypothetical protein
MATGNRGKTVSVAFDGNLLARILLTLATAG